MVYFDKNISQPYDGHDWISYDHANTKILEFSMQLVKKRTS